MRPMQRIHLHIFKGDEMKRIDQWKAKLKAAKSDIKHKTRQLNAATRSYNRTNTLIESLEKKIEVHLAKS